MDYEMMFEALLCGKRTFLNSYLEESLLNVPLYNMSQISLFRKYKPSNITPIYLEPQKDKTKVR
jgi:hypothetical protein